MVTTVDTRKTIFGPPCSFLFACPTFVHGKSRFLVRELAQGTEGKARLTTADKGQNTGLRKRRSSEPKSFLEDHGTRLTRAFYSGETPFISFAFSEDHVQIKHRWHNDPTPILRIAGSPNLTEKRFGQAPTHPDRSSALHRQFGFPWRYSEAVLLLGIFPRDPSAH